MCESAGLLEGFAEGLRAVGVEQVDPFGAGQVAVEMGQGMVLELAIEGFPSG